MSEQTPPPPPPPGPAPAQAEAEPTIAPSQGAGRGKKAVLGGIAAAVILGGGYGAYAVYDRLDGGGAQPHDVLPSTTDVYVRLDLDPSASQKVDLFRLIRKFPEFAEEIGIKSDDQDVRELVLGDLLSSQCDSIDYESDIEPWLGDRVGLGAEIADESFLLAIQTTDEAKSREGIKKLFECGNESYGIAYLDGYAIVSDQQKTVDDAITATEKGALGDEQKFVDDFEALGNQGIASAWADVEAIAEVPVVKEAVGEQLDDLVKAGSVATTLRVDGSAIELAVLSGGAEDSDAKAVPLGKLPADTVAALSVAGAGAQVREGFDELVKEFDNTLEPFQSTPDTGGVPGFSGLFSGGAQGFIDDLERSTGLTLPDDLETLFGDSLTLAIGGENLETLPTLSGPQGITTLNVALALSSDPTKALDLVQRIAGLAESVGIPLVTSPTDDGAVLATNADAAKAITDGDGQLGDEKAFQDAFPDTEVQGGFYVNVGAILDKLLEADPPQGIRDGIETASALSSIGVSSAQQDDDRSLTRFRVAFE